MTITGIRQQLKKSDRYSVYIDDKYAFSLSENALLQSGLISGQTIDAEQVAEYKKLSADDKTYSQVLRYIAMRPRSAWEIEFYLQRKHASPALIKQITNKLTEIGLLDDLKLARAFVADRRLLRPASRRKLIMELRKKRIAEDIIEAAVGSSADHEREALRAQIERLRRQTKYQDDLRLMQYLARQGFNYGDIREALASDEAV